MPISCVKSVKIYTGQKKFTRALPVAPVTNMRYDHRFGIFLLQISSSSFLLLCSSSPLKYIFVLQLFAFYSLWILLLLCQKYIFLRQIFSSISFSFFFFLYATMSQCEVFSSVFMSSSFPPFTSNFISPFFFFCQEIMQYKVHNWVRLA